jgi:hypothetical protein
MLPAGDRREAAAQSSFSYWDGQAFLILVFIGKRTFLPRAFGHC